MHYKIFIIIFCKTTAVLELLSLMSKTYVNGAMTMAQMEKTMQTMRSICGPKNKVSNELIDGLKRGEFLDDNKDLKCYTLCVAQMAGTLSKRNEISAQKMLSQIENLMPVEVKYHMQKAFEACKDVQNSYTKPCDRTFFIAKCMYEFNPNKFIFP
uniref:Odorant-binding protein 25 n=1 Tax=Propsilocerus akamusi TaxID=903466 RepID=A0A7D0TCY7_9DIPT|nr:odorant-binding protein 25 [Propsilocerus akamusi]